MTCVWLALGAAYLFNNVSKARTPEAEWGTPEVVSARPAASEFRDVATTPAPATSDQSVADGVDGTYTGRTARPKVLVGPAFLGYEGTRLDGGVMVERLRVMRDAKASFERKLYDGTGNHRDVENLLHVCRSLEDEPCIARAQRLVANGGWTALDAPILPPTR